MYLVAASGWQKDEATTSGVIADILGILVFEARQKIAGGGPVVFASFADPRQAESLADKLSCNGVPAWVIDTLALREKSPPIPARRFVLEEQAVRIEAVAVETIEIGYAGIDLLLCATYVAGQGQAAEQSSERKFSLGKTLLAGGVPMTKKVTSEQVSSSEERDETLWLYARGYAPVAFDRAVLSYAGLGDALKMTKNLNFAYLKSELQRLAPQALSDDRLLKRPQLVRLLGPNLSPETNLDLAMDILAHSLR